MLIVTGMDNSGKTTLVSQLSDHLGLEIINSPGPIPADEQLQWFYETLEEVTEDKIFERFPLIEEMIYGPILRGNSHFDITDKSFRDLKDRKPLIIYTRPTRDVIFNFGEREQYPGVIEKSSKLLDAYDKLIIDLMMEGWNIVVYDYKKGNLKELENKIKKELF